MKADKPWGNYKDLYREENIVLKIITVDPNNRLSLQSHYQRDEFWVVLEGECVSELEASVNIDSLEERRVELQRLGRGDHLIIKKGQMHRLINDSSTNPCKILELQYATNGDRCTESDIIRYRDDYGRQHFPY